MKYQWPQDFNGVIKNFLQPKSIALIGASEETRYGRRMIENLVDRGFKGKVFLINPKRSEIRGLPCYPSVLQVEDEIDLAVIVIPARAVLSVIDQCAEKGIRCALIISAGFSEREGQTGIERQKKLQDLADKHGIYICGPNCLGVANVQDKIHPNSSTEIADLPAVPGNIGLVSQSGATAFGPLLLKAKDRGTKLKYIVSTGNEVNLGSSDFIRYILDDPEIHVIASVIEGFKDGRKLKTIADIALERKKPIVMMKMGRSKVGEKAALTHTASIAGSFKVQDGFFRQKGIIRVDDYDEVCEVANLLAKGKYPKGDRVGIISHSGGICTFISDECASAGFEVPRLSEETTTRIGEIIEGWGSCENPLDLTGYAQGAKFPEILRMVINDPNVDSVILGTRGGRQYAENVMKAAEETDKPVLFMWTHSEFDSDGLPALREGGMPVFISPVKCVKALKHLRNYYKMMQRYHEPDKETPIIPPDSDPGMKEVLASIDKEPEKTIVEGRCREILAPLDLSFSPSVLCKFPEDAKAKASELGYPVVLKIDSPQILHKTEFKGVYLNIKDEEELDKAYTEMMAKAGALDPPATINGIMVQKMIDGGIELILGVSVDPLLGPVLMLGWGGIFVEALGMGSWRICPITRQDALDMIDEIPGLKKVLGSVRGRPPLDTQALVDIMIRISAIACSLQEKVSSIDFNPVALLPEGQGVKLLDCRIVLQSG